MRRWLMILLGLVAVMLVALATLPWWLAAAARPILKKWDVTLGRYERIGYSRFRVDEVRIAHNNTTVVVRGIETSTPLWLLASSNRNASVAEWHVAVTKSTTPDDKPGKIVGMPSLHTLLMQITRHLDRWLHTAEIGRGDVSWPLGGLSIEKATWRDHTLNAHGLKFLKQIGDVVITHSAAENTLSADATFAEGNAHVKATWHAGDIRGEGQLWSQPLALSTTFPEIGWMPAEASAKAENWSLPADRVKLAAQYARVTGSGTFAWKNNAFTLVANANAAPKEDVKAPELAGRIEANGDMQAITLTSLQIDAPFAKARLSAPVVIGFNGETRGSAAKLSLEADLSKQPWIESKGRVKGTVDVSRVDAPMEFQLELNGISIDGFTVAQATTRGRWLWPKLELTTLNAQLDASSKVTAAGSVDWQSRQLTGVKLDATLGREWFSRWIPEETQWKTMQASATAEGSLDAPRHAGKLSVTQMDTGAVKPFDLTGSWNGTGRALEQFSAQANAGTAQLILSGSGNQNGIDVRELDLISLGAEPLKLAQPARVDWSPRFAVSHLELKNSASSMKADFISGAAMRFNFDATNFDKEWLGQWLDIPGPTWIVQQLQATGTTVDNLLNFTVSLTGEIRAPQQTAQVALKATGDAKGIAISDLKLTDKDGRVLTHATGRFPATVQVQGSPHFRLNDTASLELQADVQTDSPIWPTIAEPAGLILTGASAQAQLKGSLKQPQGELKVNIAGLKVAPGGRFKGNLPDIESFALVASAQRNQVQIDSLSAKIEGQSVQATARLPMDDGHWRTLLSKPSEFNWDDAEGRMEVPDADLAALARRLPSFVAAQGQLKAHIELSRGGNFSGSLQISNAATRPIPGLGTMQEINGTLTFAGREARVEKFGGKLGGETVNLEGNVRFPLRAEPRIALKLSGKNLPLVRRAGLLLRSDLNLQANTNNEGVTRVSGLVTLRDGLVLSDLAALLPSGTRGVTRRPPYFAIENAPFNRWQLAVEVRGKNAVRIRTPLFTGSASAHFDLAGTLGEPRALGEVTIDQGQLYFPFATFTVQTGAVRIRAADPFTPQINVNAISRRRNYELRLEVSGTPEAPALVFSSNPPLEASQVLLMVMAGQMPADESAGISASGGMRLGQIGAYLGQGIYRGLGGSGESRLEIVSGEQISRQGRETYEVAYKLSDKWTLVGEYDEFDSYNAGLKWRIYTQEGAREREKK